MDLIRDVALKGIYSIFEDGAYSNITVNKLLKGTNYSSLERRFITELVYGTVRHKNTLEWIRDQFVTKKKIDNWINYIILMGIYQLFYMDKVPPSAACNESVELAKKYGNPGSVKFVNGVLRNISRNLNNISFPKLEEDPISHISLAYSHPTWLIKKWLKYYEVEDVIKICKYNNSRASNTLRVNTLKVSVDDLEKLLTEQNFSVKRTLYAPEGLELKDFDQIDKIDAFAQGLFIMQDEASMLVSRCLNPQPGSLIIDACAAPGSKTTHLAQLAGPDSKIIAFDVHKHKLALIKQNIKRLGINNITVKLGEAQRLGTMLKKQVDYLLLDVPCSGLGVLRRRADLRWRKTPQQIKELTKLQYEILCGAAPCLKIGGTLVYSTCTITNEENIDIIKRFLDSHTNFRLDSLEPHLPKNLLLDMSKENYENGYIQLLPHKHNMDGFFMARIVRES